MKRALLIGIDHYPTVGSLSGCVADATALADLLRTHYNGGPNFRTEVITGQHGVENITRDALRGAIADLFKSSRDTDLLFFFAGHGGQTAWGAELVAQDATGNSFGVSMSDLMTLANHSPARSVTLILDRCFSGELGNPPALQSAAVAESFRLTKTLLRENVTVMVASRAVETSAEVDGHGAFTRVLLDGLEGGATDHLGNVTSLGLYAYVSAAFDAWQQRPVLKAHITQPPVLRIGPPWLEVEMLRQLPEHFSTADTRFQLTPAHEGEGRPLPPGQLGTWEQQQFDYFGRLRNANLVTTENRRDHYWVAMESGYVYLTSLGRYFWRLAKQEAL